MYKNSWSSAHREKCGCSLPVQLSNVGEDFMELAVCKVMTVAVWLLEGVCYMNQCRLVSRAVVVLLHASPSLSAILCVLLTLRVAQSKVEEILESSSSAWNDLRLVVAVQ